MAEGDVRWTMRRGERVEVPATIGGIRAALPPEDRERFDKEIDAADVDELYDIVRRWIVVLASDEEDEEIFARLRAEGGAA